MIRFLRRFRHDESGSMTIETLVALPILFWAYLGTFAFFDGYRAQDSNVKAAYVISDALSREAVVNDAYLNGMFALQGLMLGTDQPRQMRVTTFRYVTGSTTTYEVIWSRGRGGLTPLTSAQLNAIRPNLPGLGSGEWNVMVETAADYEPPVSVGLEALEIEERVFARPRFTPNGRLCWDGGTPATQICPS